MITSKYRDFAKVISLASAAELLMGRDCLLPTRAGLIKPRAVRLSIDGLLLLDRNGKALLLIQPQDTLVINDEHLDIWRHDADGEPYLLEWITTCTDTTPHIRMLHDVHAETLEQALASGMPKPAALALACKMMEMMDLMMDLMSTPVDKL